MKHITMAALTLEERVKNLESTIQEVQSQLAKHTVNDADQKLWQWFFGIDKDNPHFENAVRFGKEWRDADRPTDTEKI